MVMKWLEQAQSISQSYEVDFSWTQCFKTHSSASVVRHFVTYFFHNLCFPKEFKFLANFTIFFSLTPFPAFNSDAVKLTVKVVWQNMAMQLQQRLAVLNVYDNIGRTLIILLLLKDEHTPSRTPRCTLADSVLTSPADLPEFGLWFTIQTLAGESLESWGNVISPWHVSPCLHFI